MFRISLKVIYPTLNNCKSFILNVGQTSILFLVSLVSSPWIFFLFWFSSGLVEWLTERGLKNLILDT